MSVGIVSPGALLLASFVAFHPKLAPPPSQKPEMVPYSQYLEKMCEKLDCYATIERIEDKDLDQTSPLVNSDVVDEEIDTVDELVKKLDKEVAGVNVSRSVSNGSVVIHLIEDELRKSGSYPPDQKLTVEYTGTLGGLLDELERRGTGISFGFPSVLPMLTSYDRDTRTSVSVTDEPARKALVDAVPLKGYSRIVFMAITYDREGSLETEVQYVRKKPEKE